MGKVIKVKRIAFENFGGTKSRDIDFSDNTKILGCNASGKTTVLNVFNWTLFNTNSVGDTKFEIRPLDKNGNKIHNVEIMGSVTLEIDGVEHEFKKVQKENWVKHHGNSEAILEGNVNTYEIDGYPKKEKDYSAFIKEIIDLETFKMLSDPRYFPGKNWKDQRKILMQMYDGKSDLELVTENPLFIELKKDVEVAPSIDDIKGKYQKALTELKKHLAEVPVRIDELMRQKVEVNMDELTAEKKKLEAEYFEIENKISANSNKQTINELMIAKSDAELTIRKIEQDAKEKDEEKRLEIKSALMTAKNKVSELLSNIKSTEFFIEDTKKRIADTSTERTVTLKKEYEAVDKEKFNEEDWQFDESTTVCSLCGQKLPDDKIDALKEEFNAKRDTAKKKFEQNIASKKKALIDKGNSLKTLEKEYSEKLDKLLKDMESFDSQFESAKVLRDDLQMKLDNYSSSVVLEDYPEYKECVDAIADYNKRIEILESSTFDESPLIEEKGRVRSQIASVDLQIASVENNSRLDVRIKELEDEQLDISQRIADQEKMLYLVDEFIKYKLNLISGAINSQFNGVEFKLFNQQINGSINECCEATINGVPYSDANSGHKLVAGLEIIKALQRFYDIHTVAFLDNAESLNDFNMPSMENQLVTMSVSEDKELRIES